MAELTTYKFFSPGHAWGEKIWVEDKVSMFSRIRGSDKKSTEKEKLECKCVNVPINDIQDDEDKVINVDCSTQPGFCLLDDSGLCTKQENAPHCSLSPVEVIGETCSTDGAQTQKKCGEQCGATLCGKRFHSYKIDLNNGQETGLVADKQCQTCGPFCSNATCTSRRREFFISWDKKRTRLFVIVIVALGLWLCIHVSVTATTP